MGGRGGRSALSENLERDLLQEGHWHSQGQFTLDSGRALEMMRRYALPDSTRYVLNLVSWAVACAAEIVRFQITSSGLELRFAGQVPSQTDLRDLFSHFGGQGLGLQELAIAAHAAASLPGAELDIESGRARLCLRGNRVEMDNRGSLAESQAGFRLRRTASVNQWFRQALGRSSPEQTWLEALAGFADIPIHVNGQPINRPFPLPEWRQGVLLGQPLRCLNFSSEQEQRLRKKPSPGEFSAFLGKSPVPLLSTPSTFLVRGLQFDMPALEIGGEALLVVVRADHLQKDLSQSQIVQDAEVDRILSWLAEESRLWGAEDV